MIATAETESVLLQILMVFVAAKLAAEAAERIRVPAVVGEIIAGIALGPSAAGLVTGGPVLRVLGEIGVILLMLEVGMQMDLAAMRSVGRSAVSVALAGVVMPFGLGFAAARVLGLQPMTALFAGAALTATSVGITARVFGDLRALAGPEARTVLGAAVADDVLGLIILAAISGIAATGAFSPAVIVATAGVALAFLVVATVAGTRLTPPLFRFVNRRFRTTGALVTLSLAFALALAGAASLAKLAPIIGAFVAGLALAKTEVADRIRRDLAPVGHLFIPVFFLQIGIDTELGSLLRPQVIALAGALLAVGVAGKVGAGFAGSRAAGDRLLVGIGMIPRGEVGLVFAGLGLHQGVLGPDPYAAILLVVLVSTLAAPPLLKWRLALLGSKARRRAGVLRTPPESGWLELSGGVVELAAEPPDSHLMSVALDAALEVRNHAPGPRLLEWLSSFDVAPLEWDSNSRRQLFELLEDGDGRSWRFLEVSGVLARALPELAELLRRRRDDQFDLDPGGALRFDLLGRIRLMAEEDTPPAQVLAGLEHPEALRLAALVLASPEAPARQVSSARAIAKRLDLGARAEEELATLVREPTLLIAAARRPDGLDEERVLQLASHIGSPEIAGALLLTGLASTDMPEWERERVTRLHQLVLETLSHPELTGVHARNLVERRRAEALRVLEAEAAGVEGTRSDANRRSTARRVDPAVAYRIARAPSSYLLSQPGVAIARHARLLEPLPGRSEVRARVTGCGAADGGRGSPGGQEGCFLVDLALRDRPGLLAATTGALLEAGIDVASASVATWPDGGAIQCFAVNDGYPPPETHLASAIRAALRAPLSAPPIEGARVSFDDQGSPWYTLCDVEAGDRLGLLHFLAVAFAAAEVDIHSARAVTDRGLATDRFELTTRSGMKLDAAAEEAVRTAIEGGVTQLRRPARLRALARSGNR